MTEGPRYTARNLVDDEPTARELPDLRAPTYEDAPPTLEAQPSPFHRFASAPQTLPGMPPPVELPPSFTAPSSAAPVIVGMPQQAPDPSAAQELASSPWVDAPDTIRTELPRPKPQVPAPGSPTFEVSRSLELQAVQIRLEAAKSAEVAPRDPPRRKRNFAAQAPTYQMLPALSRKKEEKEGSDFALIFGLLGLALVIAALVGAVAYGVVRSMDDDAPAEPAAPPAAAASESS